jgi:perosamine synthetase
VHIFGYPAAMEELGRLAADRSLGILEDAAEAAGAVDETGVRVGTRGNIAIFAFYANKQLVTGEGGIAIPSNASVAERMRGERNQGRARDMGWLGHERLGFNYRLTDLACAIGLAQLDRLDGMLADRRRVAGWYAQALAGIDGLGLPWARDSWFVYVVQLPPGVDRDETIVALRERFGVASKPYLPAIHLFSFYRERFGHRPGEFPVAEDLAERSIALPFFPHLTEGQVARVAEALEAVLQTGRVSSGSRTSSRP